VFVDDFEVDDFVVPVPDFVPVDVVLLYDLPCPELVFVLLLFVLDVPLLLFVPLVPVLFGVTVEEFEPGAVEVPDDAPDPPDVCAYAPAMPADRKNARAIVFIFIRVFVSWLND